MHNKYELVRKNAEGKVVDCVPFTHKIHATYFLFKIILRDSNLGYSFSLHKNSLLKDQKDAKI